MSSRIPSNELSALELAAMNLALSPMAFGKKILTPCRASPANWMFWLGFASQNVAVSLTSLTVGSVITLVELCAREDLIALSRFCCKLSGEVTGFCGMLDELPWETKFPCD